MVIFLYQSARCLVSSQIDSYDDLLYPVTTSKVKRTFTHLRSIPVAHLDLAFMTPLNTFFMILVWKIKANQNAALI